MKTIIRVFFMVVCIAFPVLADCYGDCATEDGLCIGTCDGDGRCILRCADAHGRCVTGCASYSQPASMRFYLKDLVRTVGVSKNIKSNQNRETDLVINFQI